MGGLKYYRGKIKSRHRPNRVERRCGVQRESRAVGNARERHGVSRAVASTPLNLTGG